MASLKKIAKYGIVIIIFFFIFAHLIVFSIAKLLPKIDIRSANSVFLYDKDDNLFFQGNGQKEWISLEKMSPHIINATLSIEDKNFFHHTGFDYFRIIKSFYENAKANRHAQGASTITQQYVKNLFLEFDKKWTRKIEEAWLTVSLEMHYSKEDILEGYLNTINYGNGVLGIENASRYYFEKSASDLTLAEASMLAGIPRSPDNYSPLNDEVKAKKRQSVILSSMVKNKYITEQEKDEAFNENLTYIGKKEKYNLATLMYYQDAVIRELKALKYVPESLLKTGGLRIYTNLDIKAQTILENVINTVYQDNKDIQTAVVVAEPQTGKVIALTGGRDFQKSQYNRAVQSKRQVGSTIKPFLYYAALENGFTSDTTFFSEPTIFTFGENTDSYAPKNFGEVYPNKKIALAAAIAYSDNVFAVKTHLFLGEDLLVDTMKRVGIKQKLEPVPSLPLGTGNINLLDYLNGYNTLANEGIREDLHLINKIIDAKGNIIYEHQNVEEAVLDKGITYILNELLTTTSDFNMVDYNTPTCLSIASKLKHKWAIKSGSTNTDSWAIGYNKKLLVGVWSGYDDNQGLGSKESKYSKNIFADIAEGFLGDTDDTWYKMPDGIVGVLTDPINGGIATEKSKKKRILYYIKGSEPLAK